MMAAGWRGGAKRAAAAVRFFRAVRRTPPLPHLHHLYHLPPPISSPGAPAIQYRSSSTDPPPRERIPEEEDSELVWSDDEYEEKKEPKIGDGGDGGGIVLVGGDVAWGHRALSIADDIILQHFDGILAIFAFRVSPKGYIYLRLDKLSDKYGCPDLEEIQRFHHLYGKSLEESGMRGEIPDNLAVEVSSPGASRLLRVPDDLERFKDLPLVVVYLEEDGDGGAEKEGVFFLVSVDIETQQCMWRLADVKENRDPLAKGRKLSREKREWRLDLPFKMLKRVTFYLNF